MQHTQNRKELFLRSTCPIFFIMVDCLLSKVVIAVSSNGIILTVSGTYIMITSFHFSLKKFSIFIVKLLINISEKGAEILNLRLWLLKCFHFVTKTPLSELLLNVTRNVCLLCFCFCFFCSLSPKFDRFLVITYFCTLIFTLL